jgi:hypothetical protein
MQLVPCAVRLPLGPPLSNATGLDGRELDRNCRLNMLYRKNDEVTSCWQLLTEFCGIRKVSSGKRSDGFDEGMHEQQVHVMPFPYPVSGWS